MKIDVLAVNGDHSRKEHTQKAALKRGLYMQYVKTIEEALDLLEKRDYSLVIIREDTVDYATKLGVMRNIKPVPIIMFSYNKPTGKIDPIRMGANMHITTPYSADYIVDCCLALVRFYTRLRHCSGQSSSIAHKHIRMCLETRKVFLRGKEIHLTKAEFDLLYLLMSNKGCVLTYEYIFYRIWGENYINDFNNTLWCHMRRLRRKLSAEPGTEDYIKTIRDVGYRSDPCPEEDAGRSIVSIQNRQVPTHITTCSGCCGDFATALM